ncbi:histidine phosphatase family protein [Oxalobacteraceae bacterium]|nr:histidine phosphatase family protein [Oxalobacteraceae bacterium]
MRLILVRHPQPIVAPGICYGSSDLPADAHALEQTLLALASLPADAPVYSSPLQRCAALARRLPCAALRFDERLAEMHFGAWEMQAWDAIPRAEIDAWAADLVHYRPGGGETVLEVATRVAAFHTALQRQPHTEALMICHAGTIRLLMACHAGLAPAAAALRAASKPHSIAYGETIILDS